MEIDQLISALEETISLLRNSRASDRTEVSIEDLIEKLESEVSKARRLPWFATQSLGLLFAPAGALQKIAIENGWVREFLRISEVIDRFVGSL